MLRLSTLCLMGPSLLAAGAVAFPGMSARAGDAAQVCSSGETPALFCYTEANGATPQNVDVADIKYVASDLRTYGRNQTRGQGPRLFHMPYTSTPALPCNEVTIYQHGSVKAIAKHINDTIWSTVTYEDIATTLDGGPDATDAERSRAIVGCLSNGGSLGVLVNATNGAYSSPVYKAIGGKPEGILIKIVANSA